MTLILRGRTLGLGLKEIGEILDIYGERGEGKKRQLQHVVARCSDKIVELDARVREAQKLRQELTVIRRNAKKALAALKR